MDPENTVVQTDAVQTGTVHPDVVQVTPEVNPIQSVTPPEPKTEQQLVSEEIARREVDSYNTKGNSIKNWIDTEYDYDTNDTGKLWVAGKINNVQTQMKFLEATLNEDLYSEMDLQKYYFDTNLATARAYAKEKKHEIAYGYYRAAQEKAIVEGQLTGWYLPAEGQYLLHQWAVADENLKDPNISAEDRARAESVQRSASGWFEANGISTRGIQCLNLLSLEETIRHNKENERLQKESLEIQRKAAANNAYWQGKSAELNLRKHQYQTGELEKDTGYDLNDDGIIGHTGEFEEYGFYTSQKDWAKDNINAALKLWGSNRTKVVLGEDYNNTYNSYKYNLQNSAWFEAQVSSGNGFISGENMDKLCGIQLDSTELQKIGIENSSDIEDATIKIIRTGDNSAALYIFNKYGVAYQIQDGNLLLKNGTTINEILNKQGLTLDTTITNTLTGTDSEGNVISLGIGKKNAGLFEHTISERNKNKYPGIEDKVIKAIENYTTNKGYEYEYGLYDTEHQDERYVLSKTEDGEKTYYAVDPVSGDVHKIKDKDKIIRVTFNPNGDVVYQDLNGNTKDYSQFSKDIGTARKIMIQSLSQSELIRTYYDEEIGENINIYMYTNPDGTVFLYSNMEGMEYYDIVTVTSKDILRDKAVPDIDEIIQSRHDEINNIYNNPVKTETPDEMIGNSIESTTDSEKKKIEDNLNNSVHEEDFNYTASDGKATDIEENESVKKQQTSNTESKTRKKTTENQVIEDHSKYVTPLLRDEDKKKKENTSLNLGQYI